jgi:hypothetical protein
LRKNAWPWSALRQIGLLFALLIEQTAYRLNI